METTREILQKRRFVLLSQLPERVQREYLKVEDLPDQFNRDEVDSFNVRRIARDLLRVEHAFKRVEEGSYGRCARCGEPMAQNRLAAVPEAPACTECEEQFSAPRLRGIALAPPNGMRRPRYARN
ncbi:MAG: hypothetical protein EXS47_01320 [Candidatus Zambryskibacteria bacterium]|nr:hypothetical protein [Candidatus Zambryskibacteria bacterium]